MNPYPPWICSASFADAHRGFRRVQLGHRRFLVDAVSVIFQPCRPQRQQPRCIDFGGHVGQLVLNRLKFGNKAAELFALLGVFERRFICALRNPYRQRRDRDPPAVQNSQTVDKSFAALPAQLRTRQAAIAEQNFARGRAAHPQLVFLLPDLESRRAFFQDERRNSVRRCRAVRHGHRHAHVRDVSVGA